MRLEANFTNISTEFQDLEDGEYIGVVEDVEDKETEEDKLPMSVYTIKVTSVVGNVDPKQIGRIKKDYVTVMNKDGTKNEMNLGRIKAYEIAGFGEAAGNSDSIDNARHKGINVRFVVQSKMQKDKKNPSAPPTKRANIVKVLPV